MQHDIQVRRRLAAEGLTCSMIMTALRKPGQMQVRHRLPAEGLTYIQVRCRLDAEGVNLLHDHDRIEEARASDNAARHKVGPAHLALQVQVGQFIHLQLRSTKVSFKTSFARTGVPLRSMPSALMLCKYEPACAAGTDPEWLMIQDAIHPAADQRIVPSSSTSHFSYKYRYSILKA